MGVREGEQFPAHGKSSASALPPAWASSHRLWPSPCCEGPPCPRAPVVHRSSPVAPAKSEPRAGYGGAAPQFRAAHTSHVPAPAGGGQTADRGTSAGAAGEEPRPEPSAPAAPSGRACSRSAGLSGALGEERPPARPRPAQASGAGDLSLARTVKTRAQKAAPWTRNTRSRDRAWHNAPWLRGGHTGLGMPVHPG